LLRCFFRSCRLTQKNSGLVCPNHYFGFSPRQ